MNCPNCMSLTAEVAEIRTIVERLDHELLGNGQPGRIKEIERDVEDLKILGSGQPHRVKEIEREMNNLKIWRAKVVGAIFFLGPIWTALVAVFCVFLAAKLKAGN